MASRFLTKMLHQVTTLLKNYLPLTNAPGTHSNKGFITTMLTLSVCGNVTSGTKTVGSTTYDWIEDNGTNGGLLLGFLKDGFPVYGPVGNSETDCNGSNVDAASIDAYNGHSHCTTEFNAPIYHYHVKTAETGGSGNSVFWVTNEYYYGVPGVIEQ